MSDKENSKKYVFNRAVIILVFICFAMAAFYFSFQSSDVKGSFLNTDAGSLIPEKIDKYIFKKYQEGEIRSKSDSTVSSTKEKSVCYEAKYIDNLFLLQHLNISFIEGKKMFAGLNALRSVSLEDRELAGIIEQLYGLFEQNESYSIEDVKERFRHLRRDIITKIYLEKMKNSFFGRVIFKTLLIQKRGTKAIEAGGVEATLERASRAMKSGDLKEAYNEVDSIEGEYHDMSEGWLKYTSQYVSSQEKMVRLNEYVNSDSYRRKFHRECS